MMIALPDGRKNEKRKHERLSVKDDAFAVVKTTSVILGQIRDISPDGLAFTYIPDDDQAKEPGEITLFVSGKTYRLDNLPIIKSFDRELKNNPSIFSTVPLRRYGVQFGKMDPKARSQLNFFISHFTL